MAEEQKVKWLSVSKVGVAMRCPRQFKFRYIEKIPEPSSGVMLAGRVVHSVLEKALRQLKGGDGLPSAQDMDDWYEPIWDEHVKEEEEKDNFLNWQWDENDPEADVKKGSRELVRVAREEILDKIKPDLIEHNMHFDLEDAEGNKFRVYGVLDIFEQDGMLSDWKTAKAVNANNSKLDIQFMGYSWWHKDHTGKKVTPARKIFLVRQKRRCKLEVKEYKVKKYHREFFATVAGEVWALCQRGTGFVANTNGWWCSRKMCGFFEGCQGDL
jgi:hypothetical protein